MDAFEYFGMGFCGTLATLFSTVNESFNLKAPISTRHVIVVDADKAREYAVLGVKADPVTKMFSQPKHLGEAREDYGVI